VLALAASCAPAFAQDSSVSPNPSDEKPSRSISYGADIAFGSGHADRGFVISDRPVLEPETWLSDHRFEFSLWSSFTMAKNTDGTRPAIVEIEVTREQNWGGFSIGPAITMVAYHDPVKADNSRTIEGWLYLSYDAGSVRFFTNHSIDVLSNRGAYYGEAGIESAGRVLPGVEVGISFAAGWASWRFNEDYAGIARSALDHIGAEGWLTAHVNSHLYIGPHFEFSTIVDRSVRAGPDVLRRTYVLVSLMMGSDF